MKTEYKNGEQDIVQKSLLKRETKPTMDMLTGKWEYDALQAQTETPKQFLKEVPKLAVTAWRELPVGEGKTTVLADIRQKNRWTLFVAQTLKATRN